MRLVRILARNNAYVKHFCYTCTMDTTDTTHTALRYLLIAGSRTYPPAVARWLVGAAISAAGLYVPGMHILHGGCPTGIDAAADAYGQSRHIPIMIMHADWHTYGRRAGPLRNARMAASAHAAILIWDGVSRGTADMHRQCIAQHIPWYCMTVTSTHSLPVA